MSGLDCFYKIVIGYKMAAHVKGCQTSALAYRCIRVRTDSVGRCLTSLGGGNRGMLWCSQFKNRAMGIWSVRSLFHD